MDISMVWYRGYNVNVPSRPIGSLQVVVEPAQEDLLWGQSQELFQGLVLIQETVKLRMMLDINFSKQATTNNLPNKTQDKMLSDLDDIASANVDN